jgi:lysophospholipase
VAEAVFCSNQNLSNIPANFPIHLLGGGEDPCTNYGKDMEKLAVRLKRNGHSNHILNTIAESRHETLNELKREDYARIFLEWLDSQLNQM